MYHLIVVHEFAHYVRGNKIEAQDEVARVLASPQHPCVVKIPAPSTAEDVDHD